MAATAWSTPARLPLVTPELPKAYQTLMKWADEIRRLRVRTNADTPHDARKAREMGAEGIGLCRTEHMFFKDFEHPEKSDERQLAIQEMIVAEDREARAKALAKLLPFQRRDFIGIFEAMDGFPVTIRLIDPPLHEFVPHEPAKQAELAQGVGHSSGDRGAPRGATARSQPDARPSRLPPLPSPIRKFWRCRCARSSKRPSSARSEALKCYLRS